LKNENHRHRKIHAAGSIAGARGGESRPWRRENNTYAARVKLTDYRNNSVHNTNRSPNNIKNVSAKNFNATIRAGPFLHFTYALLLVLAWPAIMQAQFTCITNNSAITITGYTGSGGNVIIPDRINGLPVTCIGSNAFVQRIDLTSVMIGTNVNKIGNWLFHYCYSLTNVLFPGSVTNIGDRAFDN
jgi:hypothetical protein